ncbi:hypothetical protein F2Q69_00053151 [Brassica cretica]|uniref:Uncharacterized protein n=1 Tax=Brassica cretica TaxID=69181 RepID=A0A8S9N423_BRACR|nr:hypothetical protein F2Q69_00053151 [Brassica cretica]
MLSPTRNITVLVLFLYRWWLQHRASSDSRENRWKLKLMTPMNLLATRHSRFSRKPLLEVQAHEHLSQRLLLISSYFSRLSLATSGSEINEEVSSDCHQTLASTSRELSRQAGHHQHKLVMIILKRHGVISFTIKLIRSLSQRESTSDCYCHVLMLPMAISQLRACRKRYKRHKPACLSISS